jgi:putative Mg2+ transporter-C (MgtC) family protein
VRVTAHLTALHRIDAEVEKIVGRISLEPTITAARWEAQAHLDPESPSALGH